MTDQQSNNANKTCKNQNKNKFLSTSSEKKREVMRGQKNMMKFQTYFSLPSFFEFAWSKNVQTLETKLVLLLSNFFSTFKDFTN